MLADEVIMVDFHVLATVVNGLNNLFAFLVLAFLVQFLYSDNYLVCFT